MVAVPALAQTDLEKELGIRQSSSNLVVQFEPVRNEVQVNEAIRFRIKGNQTFYLYLFSINPELNRAVMLIPNDRHGNKYEGGTTYTVPNPNLEFYADEPGLEKVVMVASTRYLQMDKGLYDKSGPFMTASAQQGRAQVKELSVRAAREKAGKVSKEVNIRIQPSPMSEFSSQQAGSGSRTDDMVFVSCNQESYRIGDSVRVAFGASRSGWVHLYYVEPNGERSLLTRQQVETDTVNYIRARAESPAGRHALVAVYSKGRSLQGKELPENMGELAAKGLSLEEPEQPPYAVYRFQITR
jgi:hypothetical protein